MKTLFKLSIAFALVATLGSAQVILSTTTLGAAVAAPTTTNPGSSPILTLASTSTMQSAGPQNQINTCLYIDRELFGVVTVLSSTQVQVQQRGRGCGAIGQAARPMAHANGATVYFANTVTYNAQTGQVIPAATYIGKNDQPTAEFAPGTTCVAANEIALPRIYYFSGTKLDCVGATGTQVWVEVDKNGPPVLGTTVASPAGVMATTGTIFTVSGTNAITGITVPNGAAPGYQVTLIPSGAFTTTNAGNIRIASTAVVGKTLVMTWDGTKFDPSY